MLSSRGFQNSGVEPSSPTSPALQADSLPGEPWGKPLMSARWQVFFVFFLNSLRAHHPGGCSSWWLWRLFFTDMAGSTPFLNPIRPRPGGFLWVNLVSQGIKGLKGIFHYHKLEGKERGMSIQSTEARDLAEHPTVHQEHFHNKNLSGPKCQKCWSGEALSVKQSCLFSLNLYVIKQQAMLVSPAK